jgi:hypothetical protein
MRYLKYLPAATMTSTFMQTNPLVRDPPTGGVLAWSFAGDGHLRIASVRPRRRLNGKVCALLRVERYGAPAKSRRQHALSRGDVNGHTRAAVAHDLPTQLACCF